MLIIPCLELSHRNNMYECPNCGGGLKFHIASQDLFCSHCDSHHDPYKIVKQQDGIESSNYETTVYTCPQCGAEIISEAEEAAAFCSYCGGSTILTKRLEEIEKPARIIPFKITKESCKDAYVKQMRRAYFSPKAIRDASCIDSFRGIYMPYWMYHVKMDAPIKIDTAKTYADGPETVTDSYHVDCNVSADFPGIPYDASETFSDRISSAVLPYDMSALRSFTPSLLSGFYADTANVDKAVYTEEALDSAREEMIRQLQEDPAMEAMELANPEDTKFPFKISDCSCALFPVWFFSYRNGNRVSYAAVNGQTGKVFADTPVDPKRYTLASLLLALPIFLLLNLFFTLKPQTLLNLSAIFLLMSIFLFRKNMQEIENRKQHKRMKVKRRQAKSKESDKKKTLLSRIGDALITFMLILMFGYYAFLIIIFGIDFLAPISVLVYLFIWIRSIRKNRSAVNKGFIVSAVASVCILLLTYAAPAEDIFYYGGTLICMGAVLYMIYELIRSYNTLSTEPLPQFNRTGGDDRA